MSSSNQFRLPPTNPYKKTSKKTSKHRKTGTGNPTNPVPNPYEKPKKPHKPTKPYEPTNDTKINKYKIDGNDMIDRKHNEFATSISNDPNFYGHSYGFTPPACGTKPRADTSNIATTSTTLPFNAPKKPSFFNNRDNAYSYASNADSTRTPLKNDKNLKQEFDWERTNQSQCRSHSYAESDAHLSDRGYFKRRRFE